MRSCIGGGCWGPRAPLGGSAAPDPALPPRPVLIHAHTGYPDGAAAAGMARLGVPLVITEHASFVDRLMPGPRDPRRLRRRRPPGHARDRRERDARRRTAGRHAGAGGSLRGRPQHDPGRRLPGRAAGGASGRRTPLRRLPPRPRASRCCCGLRRAGPPPVGHVAAHRRQHRPALEDRWLALAASLGVADAVSFEPAAARATVAEAMARTSVFVHPSRRETFGIVAAEALASGTPVVATASGGVPEILGNPGGRRGPCCPAIRWPSPRRSNDVSTTRDLRSRFAAWIRGRPLRRGDRCIATRGDVSHGAR